jgi:hypothetical protein
MQIKQSIVASTTLPHAEALWLQAYTDRKGVTVAVALRDAVRTMIAREHEKEMA